MDLAISKLFFETFSGNKPLTVVMRILTEIGSWWFIVGSVLVLLIFKKTRKVGLFVGIACLLAFITNNLIIKNIIKRARPFEIDSSLAGMCNLVGYKLPNDYSMASGHSTATMTFAVMVFMFNKKVGIITIITSLIVGLTRLYLCVHFLTDIIIGFIIGITFAISIYYLLECICNKFLKHRGCKNETINISNKKST